MVGYVLWKVNDDFFIVIPKADLVPVKYTYTDSLSLTRMKANPDFELTKITK